MGNAENAHIFLILAVFSIIILAVAFVLIHRSNRRVKMDPVTGGLNNYGLTRKMRKLLAGENHQYSVVVVRICNYRQIMQTFGNEKSEQVLRYFYGILQRLLSGVEPVARPMTAPAAMPMSSTTNTFRPITPPTSTRM